MSAELVFKHTVSGLQNNIDERLSVVGGSLNQISEPIPGPSTNLELALVIDVSQMKACVFYCETANINLFFNEASTGSPSKTLNLIAGEPFIWHNRNLHANPFGSTDVTALFVTKSGAGDVVLRGAVLVDPTV